VAPSTIDACKGKVQAFCENREWDQFHTPDQLAIGVTTEAAELLEIFRFKSSAETADLMASKQGRERVSDELADVFFFLLRFAQLNHIELAEALDAKLAKNEAKYPISKAKGRNLKYDELT
jgi:NTP pyrophosphatase (non-canonical NTP hydrolase)